MADLATERLVLRPLATADLEPLTAMHADPAVMDWLAGPLDRDASLAFIARSEERWARDGMGFWSIRAPDEPTFLGLVSLLKVAFDAPFAPAVEVGWRLTHGAWGRGIATEAATAALRFGFGPCDLDEVVAFTIPANRRSRAVMERLGMRHAAAGDFDHPRFASGSAFRRHVLYRLSAADWRHR